MNPIQKRPSLKTKLDVSSAKSKATSGEPSSSQEASKPRHDFIKDRIARRKEAEDSELGQEENEGAEVVQPDDISMLRADEIVGN